MVQTLTWVSNVKAKYTLKNVKSQPVNQEVELLQLGIELWCWEAIKRKTLDSLI